MASESSYRVGPSGLGPGKVLDGKYEILTRIGGGGMGEVFKARHVHLNAYRCIKVMKQELLADEVFRSRFLREARLAVQIHHPNIAVVHDFFVGEDGNYMVTEFIDGRTLRQWSAAHGPFPLALAADVASQVLGGLDHIHRRGLLHRDISPDNVMLTFDSDGRYIAKIIDMGIAKDVNTIAADATQAGVLIGNPKYMSPEQLGLLPDGEQIDGRADLYCLGVVLYEMLLGVPPFVSETPHGYIMKHLTQPPRRFADAKPRIALPDAIESIIFRTLEKNRAQRFASARELAAALAPFLVAPAGTLTADDIDRLRRGNDETVVGGVLPQFGADSATVAERGAVPVEPALSGAEGGAETPWAEASAAAPPELDAEAEEAFQRAWEDGRTSAWRTFLETYPQSPRTEEAKRLLDEAAAFEAAAQSDSDTAIRQFLGAFPDARHHLEAEILLAKAKERSADRRAYEEARAEGKPAAWRAYLAAYPSGAHAEDARTRLSTLETVAHAAIRASKDPKAAADLLADFPDSSHRPELEKLIADAEDAARAQREPADFDMAFEVGTSAVWDQFLREHPRSPRAAEARNCRQEAVDFELATATNTPVMWRAFIKTWPSGRHRIDAEIRLSRK